MADAAEQVKLLVTYDVHDGKQEEYFQFVLGEFVPAVQNMGLIMTEAWHTAYGEYPVRLAGFVADDYAKMASILHNSEFLSLEERLKEYVFNYNRRVVPLRNGFQW